MFGYNVRINKSDLHATEGEKRAHRCCFTGHRPEKLTKTEEEIKVALRKEISVAVNEGFNVFITGMARGVDLWAAEIVFEFRQENEAIKLICAVPYVGFEAKWPWEWQQLYKYILQEADLVRYIRNGYFRSVFQVRNEWMVDHSAKVIAVINDPKSGTKNTIDYAIKQGIPVRIIEG